ncbi:MAG: tRNA (adenosine(37)-N6)-dimethylallyltransferase MiaA [Vicinamibacterales bacterium]|nr:tRNA (adenosine(37)-N6)-dimethylallyltransferase MiaA [Vicinamibacterales bacterium]
MTHGHVVAVLGPTASGKSALAVALAARFDGEVVACDSTAVYRGFDIGTDKVPPDEQQGIPHHLVDVVGPADDYTAADYARDAKAAIDAIVARGRLPILVGGTGFYYRALTRGLFPGAGREPVLRARLDRIAARFGAGRLHRLLAHIDPPSAARIQVRDLMRTVRALEVYYQTGRTLTAHFAETRAPLEGWTVTSFALKPGWADVTARIARRVDQQFERGILDEVRALLAAGVPTSARPFTGYVYRRVLEHLQGQRDEAATRALIVQENRQYARRQLIWFRKEPNLRWILNLGDRDDTIAEAVRTLARDVRPGPPNAEREIESQTHAADV